MTKENGFPDLYVARIPKLSTSDLLADLICYGGHYEVLSSRSKGYISANRKQECEQDLASHRVIFASIKKEILKRTVEK